jgi:hypothetical protein
LQQDNAKAHISPDDVDFDPAIRKTTEAFWNEQLGFLPEFTVHYSSKF